jgi:hypothetical protein
MFNFINKEKLKKIVKNVLTTIAMSCVMFLFMIVGIEIYIYCNANDWEPDTLEVAQTDYWATKDALMNEVNIFIKKKAPTSTLSPIRLINACDEFEVDIRLLLAQGTIESYFGTKGLAKKTNSVWNMGAFDNTVFDDILYIYKYEHPDKSIRPYLKKIRNSYLGKKKTELDLLNNFVNLSGQRYATSENYEKELKIVWDEINTTTKIDSLLNRYEQLKILAKR